MEDDQQYCLRWNNHQSTLIQNFDTLLESGTLVDCTLAAEGKHLKAHKVVLSACSPYFEGLLSEHYDKHPVFILKDVKFKELKAMMDYMYRGEVNISQDQLTALLKAAESLQIKGLSDSRTGGTGSTTGKADTRPAKTASSTAASSSVDIPHASSGLTIEKNSKVPRQSLQQVSVSDLPEDSASPQLKGLSSREGSQSPTRKRKRLRRRSLGNDDTTTSMENHEASNSSDVNISAPALGVAPVAEEKTHADPADSIGRSALMQQLTKPADEMLQIPIEKPEPSEEMIQPKSEYLDDQESVEDLTNLDDDMNDLNEMEQDNSRPGPSHDPSQHGGIASWHIAGDRSNASVVGVATGAPGQQDEAFLAAHDAAQAQRDSQDFQILMSALEEINEALKDISKNQRETNNALTMASDYIVKDEGSAAAAIACDRGFADKHNIELPIKDLREFLTFDNRLKSDEGLRRDFTALLPTLVDRHNIISKSTTNILRKFMTRAVVLKFTVQKKITDKIVLKDTTFCRCTLEVLLKMHRDNRGDPVTEKDIFGAFGSSLNNAKDWDGYRSQRKEKEKKEQLNL